MALAIWPPVALSQSSAAQDADVKNNSAAIANRAAEALKATLPNPLNEQERGFIAKAMAGGAFEAEASSIGARRAVAPAVKSYAQTLVEQHGQANKELAQMVSERNAEVPPSIAPDKRETIAMLHKTTGFDATFIRSVGIEAHQADIALFEQAYAQTEDAPLKAWIGNKLPIWRAHLAQAQQIAQRNVPDKTPSNSGTSR
jgi:putative membrane protein